MDEIDILREEQRRLFADWRKKREEAFRRGQKNWHLEGGEDFTNAWSIHAYICELEKDKRGSEINKLAHRIGRQREANRKLQWRIKELEKALDRSYEMRKRLERELGYKEPGASGNGTDFETVGPAQEPRRHSAPEYGPGTIIADGERPEVQGAVDKAGRKSVRESLGTERARLHETGHRLQAKIRLLQEEGAEKGREEKG